MARHVTVVPGSVTTRECVFCGANHVPMSDEHVFGDWIHRLFGKDPNGEAELTNAQGVTQAWSGRLFSDVLTIVCENECNNRWMSVTENDVSALLGPMMLQGWTTGLPPRFQAKLAAWAVKTALVADYLHAGHGVVPEAEYDSFYRSKDPRDPRRRLPLGGQMVWIAHRATFVDGTGRTLVGQIIKERMTQVTLPDGADLARANTNFDMWTSQGMGGYYFTIACGHVVCQVFGHNFPTKMVINVDGGGPNEIIRQIWPVSTHLTWPPPVAVEAAGGLEILHRAFHPRQ
jgi:hypothetical protein